jgi:hypothetical protein
MTVEVSSEGTNGSGGATVSLTATEYKELTDKLATKVQDTANMTQELIDLRKKNKELSEQPQVATGDISKVVDAELQKRDAETMKVVQANALSSWLDAHPEFSNEEDKDGSKLAAFQKALGRMNLIGIKTEQDYIQVLNDALRLTEQVSITPTPIIGSAPRGAAYVPGRTPTQQFLPAEQKLIKDSFGGDVQKYLAVKQKRPEYIEEILKWVK